MTRSRGLGRGLVAAAAGASLLAAGPGVLGAGAQDAAALPAGPATPLSSTDRVDAEVTAELEDQGSADFWIDLGAKADLSPAYEIEDWEERGQFVYDALTSTAEASQSGLRAELDAAGVDYEAFYATNAIRVTDGDASLVDSLSTRSDVDQLRATFEVEPPEAELEPPTEPHADAAAIEWNLQDVKADEVWAQGATGEGIVVASIDTGVEWDHPGLVNHYRGFNGGDVNHNYSWFDATGKAPKAPADRNGHGTHVTGTMVGGDGGKNRVGMAPGAQWIATNGCSSGCTDRTLLASGQWTLAPTNLAGKNPNAALRPHIINNSWGSTIPSTAPLLEDISEAWAASGQFAVFSNGNSGQWGSNECRTSTSPGSRIINYSVGNYTQDHTINPKSSRGGGQDGVIKPDISAPGTSIRSTYKEGQWGRMTGTSMAAPHVAGAVALLWSARPDLRGDVEVTRALLDGSAIDTDDTSCGGTPGQNNVWGEGRLNALGLINSAPATPVHRLSGPDRYATAAAIAAGYQADADVVYLATGRDYPDALVGAALAGTRKAPVLLTKSDTMPSATSAQLKRLNPSTVILLGGPQVISAQVLGEVQALLPDASTGRRAGANRYETAARIAQDFNDSEVVYVATGTDYPDALAGAARAGALDAPVLLTQPDHLPSATAAELSRLQPERIVLLGGPTAISQQVSQQLQGYAPTQRVAGPSRYGTAAQLSRDYETASTIYISTGRDWPDALAGAARAGRDKSPILLVQHDNLPNATVNQVRRLSPDRIFVLGGPQAISTANEIELGRIE